MRSLGGVAACLSLLAAPAAAQPAVEQPATYIHAGALLDRPGQAPRGASTLVVRNGRIEAVQDGFAAAPAGARVIDLKDQFVLPGLIDMHVHIFSDDDKARARMERVNRDIEDELLIGVDNARRTLEAGFTTIRDLGSEARAVTSLRDAINAGAVPGPTIVPAARMVSISGGHGDSTNGVNRDTADAARARTTSVCDGPEDCRRAVRAQIGAGAEVIKFASTGGVLSNVAGGLGQHMNDDEMVAIVETAHMLGRKVAVHAHGKAGVDAALRAGVDSVEHGTYLDAATFALFKKSGAYLVPTMLAPRAALAQAKSGVLPPAVLPKAEEAAAIAFANHKAAIASGVKIAFGTDTGVSSHGDNAQEFALMVEAGMSPAEAIKAATVNAADLLGRSDRIGSLEAGKDADIVAVAKSPLADVTELERPTFVMKRGVAIRQDGRRQPFPPEG
jgi:imidazolonepropionase-like amidohydrolase